MSDRLQIPLVLSCELLEAERLLREAGVDLIDVTQTAPPRRRPPAGPPRVVRQRITARGVQLVVAPSVPLLQASRAEPGDDRAK